MGLELTMKMPLEGWTFASSSAKGVKWMFCVRAHISANNSANITAFNNVCHLHLICASALFICIYTCTFSLHLHFFFALEFVCAIAFCMCSLRIGLALVHISIEGYENSWSGIKHGWSGIKDGWSGIKGGKQSAGHEGSRGSGCSISLDALGFHEERHRHDHHHLCHGDDDHHSDYNSHQHRMNAAQSSLFCSLGFHEELSWLS